ncbi:hypothetical protein JST56_04230 [Candidatus Dependentiae bacterium]|nr:hypothetical protein [Candidatus Dependentiae bacterium]
MVQQITMTSICQSLVIPGSIHFNGRDAKTYPKVESLLKSKRFSKQS